MEQPKRIYVDAPSWELAIRPDDFLVAIGKNKSNSVYHVAEVRPKLRENRTVRYHLKVYKSDLITMLRRDKEQQIFTVTWYSRKKKV